MSQAQVVEEYQNTWRWHPKEEKLVHDRCIGSVLHVCNGQSQLGDVKLDLFTKCDIQASALALPFKNMSFDTVVSDPPWNLAFIPKYWKELKRVARKRVIVISLSAMKPGKGWSKPKYEVLANRQGFQLKVMTTYDKLGSMTLHVPLMTKERDGN